MPISKPPIKPATPWVDRTLQRVVDSSEDSAVVCTLFMMNHGMMPVQIPMRWRPSR